MKIVLLAICSLVLICGCSSTELTTPDGWRFESTIGAMSKAFDKGEITVNYPDGTVVTIRLENYKTDAQTALELAQKIAIGAGTAGAGIITAAP